ncbi:hypothetical protein RN001_003380 [Aquatica leii]|uniref:Kinesin-like protein n=1 Tax=Aquatica leii TaxID=1421715 RepID=A0AAN7PI81_9COLE|nr:hypothetical protein RN001_003380 [Aquatica leii]
MFIESLSVDGVLSLFKNGLLNPDEIRSAAEVINAKLNRGVDSVSPGNVVLYKCFNEIASRITAVSNLQVVEQPQRSSIVNSTSMSGQPEYQEQPLNLCGTANNQIVGDTLQSENMRLVVHPQNLSNRMHHEVGETPRPSTSRNSEDHFNTLQAVSSGSNRGILHGGGVQQREGFSYITVMTETDRFIRRFNMTAKTVIFSFKPVDADNPFEWLKNPYKYTINISYLEIYNEVGYDLLNSKRQFCSGQDLPKSGQKKVNKEKIKIHNIKSIRVCSEEEAMMLLLVGDSNRMTVETSRNLNSSRSHCIFTIHIISKIAECGKILNSKLSLIDLAGSERICKSNISGLTLKEAKSINLSLHYLQDVVRVLCQKNAYVPFRNSLLTYLLKDSLGGNCITVLIATLDLNKNNFEETISTCKFSHNVGQVFIETGINKSSPAEEIRYLKNIIEDLRNELNRIATFKQVGSLTKEEIEQCKMLIQNYLKNPNDELQIRDLDMREIRYCFKYFKQLLKKQENENLKIQKQNKNHITTVKEYKDIVKHQQKQIDLVHNEISLIKPLKTNVPITIVNNDNLKTSTKSLLKHFLKTSENEMGFNYYINAADEIVKQAKDLTSVVEQCQKNISNAKEHLQDDTINPKKVIEKILSEQNIYKASLLELEKLKFETEHLKTNLSSTVKEITTSFNTWYDKQKMKPNLITDDERFQNCNVNAFNKIPVDEDDIDKENCFDHFNEFSSDFRKSKLSYNKTDSFVLKDKNPMPLYKKDVNLQNRIDNEINIENVHFFFDSPETKQFLHNSLCNAIVPNNTKSLSPSKSAILSPIPDNCTDATNLKLETINEYIGNVDTWQRPERDSNVIDNKTVKSNLLKSNDTAEFKEFLSKVAFTGDDVVDEEIVNFYRTKFLYSCTS